MGKHDLDLKFLSPPRLLCFSSTRLPLWRLSSFLSFSRRLDSPLLSPSLSLSLCRADGSGLGCDPITGWLQQSPSADWFYNPHSGSQMGENQLAKKCCSESCHTDARTDGARVEKHTHSPTFFLSLWIYIIVLDYASLPPLSVQRLPTNVCACMCGWTAMIEQQRGAVLYLKRTVILIFISVCVCAFSFVVHMCVRI